MTRIGLIPRKINQPTNQLTNQVLLWIRVNLGVMAMKENSTFIKAPGLKPCH